MGSIFRPKMPSLPPVQPLPEPPVAVPEKMTSEEKEIIAKEQAAIERKRRGRKSTILTSPLGVEEEAKTEDKTLLGS